MKAHVVALVALTMSITTLITPAARGEDGFEPLFDGKTLTGWHNPYEWGKVWIEDGLLCLQADKKFFLMTERQFGDFILEAEIMLPDTLPANSGIMLRAHVASNKVFGYQCECDPTERAWAGGLYDEGRRNWLHPRKGQQKSVVLARAPLGDWIKYRIECIGDHLVFYVNGQKTVDYRDPLDVVGPIGVQHHGEKGKIYKFRNIRIKDLGKRAWQPLFDGKTLTGWTALPGGEWGVVDGVIVGKSAASEKRHGLLVSDKTYDDFVARLKFKVTQGDSGFYFRAEKVDGAVGVAGFQVEIDTTPETGGLYETNGREWVVKPDAEQMKKVLKASDWNDLAVSSHGGRIVVHVNGVKTAELLDDPGRKSGHLALQLHGGQDMHVEFKDIEILGPAQK